MSGMLLAILEKAGFISPVFSDEGKLAIGTGTVAAGYQNFICCLEMVLAALLYKRAFPVEKYSASVLSNRTVSLQSISSNLKETMNPRDIMADAVHNFHPNYQHYTQHEPSGHDNSSGSRDGGHDSSIGGRGGYDYGNIGSRGGATSIRGYFSNYFKQQKPLQQKITSSASPTAATKSNKINNNNNNNNNNDNNNNNNNPFSVHRSMMTLRKVILTGSGDCGDDEHTTLISSDEELP